ncbi:MAG: hypothetical protein ABJO88_13785 [Parasphingorhabdus sp.]
MKQYVKPESKIESALLPRRRSDKHHKTKNGNIQQHMNRTRTKRKKGPESEAQAKHFSTFRYRSFPATVTPSSFLSPSVPLIKGVRRFSLSVVVTFSCKL